MILGYVHKIKFTVKKILEIFDAKLNSIFTEWFAPLNNLPQKCKLKGSKNNVLRILILAVIAKNQGNKI